MKFLKFSILLALVVAWTSQVSQASNRHRHQRNKIPYDVYHGWKIVNYNFSTPELHRHALATEAFIPKNVIITGLKVHPETNRIFLTTPRFKEGVPATVSWIPYTGADNYLIEGSDSDASTGPLLNPYPSWDSQKTGGDCSGLQLVQAMEIDTFNRLWLIDTGRLYALSNKSDNTCPPKIVLVDLTTDTVEMEYVFPSQVVSYTDGFPKDVTLDCQDKVRCLAYIVNLSENKLVVFDLEKKTSWDVRHSSMAPSPQASDIVIRGKSYNIPLGISGMGLSPKSQSHDVLYYSCIADNKIYSIRTKFLKNPSVNGTDLPDSNIRLESTKAFNSDGMTMDAAGNLYYGSLQDNAVYRWNMQHQYRSRKLGQNRYLRYKRYRGAPELVAQNDQEIVWQDTYGFDNSRKHLFLMTDKFQLYDDTEYDFQEVNFRILRFKVRQQSYLY